MERLFLFQKKLRYCVAETLYYKIYIIGQIYLVTYRRIIY